MQDFGDYSDSYQSYQTSEGEQIAQLIGGYIDIILKKVTFNLLYLYCVVTSPAFYVRLRCCRKLRLTTWASMVTKSRSLTKMKSLPQSQSHPSFPTLLPSSFVTSSFGAKLVSHVTTSSFLLSGRPSSSISRRTWGVRRWVRWHFRRCCERATRDRTAPLKDRCRRQ